MGAGHSHPLHRHGHSVLHRTPPEVKVLGAVLLVSAFAVTPPQAPWAFGLHALLLGVLLTRSDLPVRFVAARATVVLPFIAFAAFIPFIATGEQVEVLGVGLSREGLVGAGNIVAKALLGVTASILLAGTTTESRILLGMQRLRVPPLLTQIASFMLRYLSLLASELGRMRTAMTARGYDPRWLWQAKPIASSAGALFIRGYERGERIHSAMLARGYTGAMPEPDDARATTRHWLVLAALGAVAWTVTTTALVTT